MNTVCHIEFDSTNLERSQRFFEGLFGWNFRVFSDEMVVFGTDEGHIGGLQKAGSVTPGDSPSVWFHVADVEEMLERATASGGRVLKGKSEVPNVGWSGQVADPDGNPVGLVQFAEKA
jgi:uncharacterized protein